MLYLFVLFMLSLSAVSAQDLPTDETSLFSGSGNCVMCHESNGQILIENGKDISPVTQWRSTMMANSSKDPLWRAKVATELNAFPQHADLIQNRCTICHVPAGHTQNNWDGDSTYSLTQLDGNPLHRDGVTCTVCHQIQPGNLGTPASYGGGYEITGVREIYGPYSEPLQGPMINFVGYTPMHGAHTNSSELCATCHTLITPTLDEAGNIIGEFPEQTPYIEWKNSFYGQEGNVSCQSCHMRVSQTAQDLSPMPPWHQVLREPYYQHIFVGANLTMLELLRANADDLGVTAGNDNLDTTLVEVRRSLTSFSCTIGLDAEDRQDSTILRVTLTNLTGHKLPTGIPLRRMWIHVRGVSENGTVLFESGRWNSEGEITGYDTTFEPHYDVITDESQVQVYEAVMGDDNGNRTWTLLRASTHLKDNRLPPLGFTSTHASYDTCEIFGVPAADSNFNRSNGTEGSGSDVVTYHMPRCASVSVSVMFQTVQPALTEYLAGHDLPETNLFTSMYDELSPSPVLMVTDTLLLSQSVVPDRSVPLSLKLHSAYPNPFNSVTRLPVELPAAAMVEFTLYDIRGRRIMLFGQMMNSGRNELTIDAGDLASGVYMLHAQVGKLHDTQRLILVK